MTTPTHFVLIPAEDYRNLRDDLTRIREILEARQPEPSRHITMAKWAREAGLEIEATGAPVTLEALAEAATGKTGEK